MNYIKKIIIYLHLAWIWLFLVLSHMFLTNFLEYSNLVLRVLDPIVFFSSFLIYPAASNMQSEQSLYFLFSMQFTFWAIISVLQTTFIVLVNHYANKNK